MGWLQLTIGSDSSHVEEIGELLEEFGADSVSYQARSEEPVFADEPGAPVFWHHTTVMALLDDSIDLDILIFCIRNRVGTENIYHHDIRVLPDQVWTESHKHGHTALTYNQRLCVCPSWCSPPAGVNDILRLDPGLAFGSGSHATTAMCLEWLAAMDLTDRDVIDYGCGSGVLGLSASLLGAARVRALDIDDQALTATRDNAVKNRLQDGITVSTPADMSERPADILVANILLNPLLSLAPRFHALLRPDGHVVLSGILASQVSECLDRYQLWFEMEAPRFRDEWALLCGRPSRAVPGAD